MLPLTREAAIPGVCLHLYETTQDLSLLIVPWPSRSLSVSLSWSPVQVLGKPMFSEGAFYGAYAYFLTRLNQKSPTAACLSGGLRRVGPEEAGGLVGDRRKV